MKSSLAALRARAPAKVNLVLRVGSLRSDGYHDLETLLVPLDLADDVEIRVARGRRGPVSCRVPNRPELDGSGNLAARAAEAFRRRFGVSDRVDIIIEKRIPVIAGLGGGSSDAASVLRALSRVYQIRDREGLAAAALEIGSDVPFFLAPGPCWATGRGEKLTAAKVPTLHLVLAYPLDPSFAIRAADAYRWFDASSRRENKAFSAPLRQRQLSSMLHNDLEGPCFERHPFLGSLAGHLVGQGAARAIMSGSGPTVFGLCPDRAAARRAAAGLRRRGSDIEVHVARTLQRHPGVSGWISPRSASSRSAKRN